MQHLNSTFDIVLILEELDKSLVLLGRALGLSMVELAYTSMKMGVRTGLSSAQTAAHSQAHKARPSATEEVRLRNVLHVDGLIYRHFLDKLLTLWNTTLTADPTLTDDLELLNCLNEQLQDGCARGQRTLCHHAYDIPGTDYTSLIHHHGGFTRQAGQIRG